MMGTLLTAAKTCRPDDDVYGGGSVVTGCLPHTGSDVWLYVLAGVVLVAFGLVLWFGTRERHDG